MIPANWIPYHRLDDDELIGYLAPAPEAGETLVRPVTLFGYPLDEPCEPMWAEETLEERGLSYLAVEWLLTEDAGERAVVINESSPDRLVVANADFAKAMDAPSEMIGTPIVLDVPTDRLRPARPL